MAQHKFNLSVVTPDNRAKDSVLKAIKNLAAEIFSFRDQIGTVYRQNFRNSYHGTGFGVLWNFILPLVPLTVYLFLTKIRVFPSFDGVDGATYLTFGVTMWFVFTGFVLLPITTVNSRKQQAMKTSLPLSTSIVSAFANLVFETAVRICLVAIIIIVNGSWPTWFSPLVFLLFLPGFFLFFGAGLILSIMNVIYKDVARLVTIILQYGIFVSGVIFPLGSSELIRTLNNFNPFAVMVDACREIVFKGQIPNWIPLSIWSGIGIVIFILGCRLFYVMEYRIREIG